ncbi:MAG TPA: 2-amino-4-hydroxy-6-hydroxymethyldihydropteridine diphosphokinase [Selenomonadales bacterium]|nr:2-amino-4-hydroxy-6-hydroxymethyldihydropteridine diphosphokinase [Selenomonadales bacterium]
MIILGLGSNVGDREGNIRAALEALARYPDIELIAVSSLYETAPVGFTDQPDFLNAAARISTALEPLELLQVCLGIERDLGRVREVKWGPRTMDIDLLIYDAVELASEQLTLPHPRLHERCFVLVPLAEIAPDVPVRGGKTAAECLAGCTDSDVRLYKKLQGD